MFTILAFVFGGLLLGGLGKLGQSELQRFAERKRLGLTRVKHKELRRLVSYDWYTNNTGHLKADNFISNISTLDSIDRRKVTEAYQKLHTAPPPVDYQHYAEKTKTHLKQLENLREKNRTRLIPPERRNQLNSGFDTPRELL